MKKRLKTMLVLVTAAISFAAIITVSGCATTSCSDNNSDKTPGYGQSAHKL
jgi:hypothetical protein